MFQLITNRANIAYLTGFTGTAGWVVTGPNMKALFTDARYHIVAKKVLPKGWKVVDTTKGFGVAWQEFVKKNRVRSCEIEGADMTHAFFLSLKKLTPKVKFSDAGKKISSLRMVKLPHEIAAIKKAQEITDRIYVELQKYLKIGVKESDIAWKVEVLAREYGAQDISFPPIIAFGENSAAPHHNSGPRKLKKGDVILIDMGVLYNNYCSDMTRMYFTAPPTNEQRTVYETVRAAQEKAEGFVKAGIKGAAADKVARDHITAAGYGKYFGHSLGHGIGLEVHELPNLSSRYTEKIPEGTIVTVEPGIYLEGKFGVRLEDMVLVTKIGVKNLTGSSKHIQVIDI
ncbi:aminopeptidase P family protein [Candidatus Gracilibacteria bacterium]|nr:aminopeptidase P family protein [Candidatus Gracilibacteria bacterium]